MSKRKKRSRIEQIKWAEAQKGRIGEMKCNLCPRHCGADREKKETGVCGQTDRIKIARAALHMWEEPCISGKNGSGTVFFSGCALHCVFCQNDSIANGTVGREISEERLTEIFLELQEKGANNINLVTAGHFLPQVIFSLKKAKDIGLTIPVVYNTGSYESVDAIKSLEGLVDIYLPDLKSVNVALSEKYSHAKDYFTVASEAIEEMVRQVGKPEFQKKGTNSIFSAEEYNEICDEDDSEILMKKGVIVRHLLLPGCVKDAKKVIAYLLNTYGNTIYISIMNQFTPLSNVEKYPELNRKVTEKEYDAVVDYAISLGIENAFIQEGDVAKESFIPQFES